MGIKINVDPTRLDTSASHIEQQAKIYETTYHQLFQEVNQLGSGWQGKDNLAFVNQIKGFELDFKAMSTLMIEYANFLKLGAKIYRETQNEQTAQARRLAN